MKEVIRIQVDPELASIMPQYMKIRTQELGELNAAIAANESETVRILGHRLKGTGASYGFPELSEMGAQVEDAGQSRNMDVASMLAERIGNYLQRVELVYPESAE